MFGGGFSAAKLKPQLKMAVGRIEILKNKKTALLKQSMRQVALLLAEDPPKEEKARIRAEALIRDDNLIEALEIIQLECELLHERIKLLEYSKDCPPDLVSVISTIIWAAHRVDVTELLLIRKQFKAKYGTKFEENAMNNVGGVLNERVVMKLSVQPPAAYLVQVYLDKICEQYEVDWKPLMKITANDMIVPIQAPTGISVPAGAGTGLGPKLASVNTGFGRDDDNNNNNDPYNSHYNNNNGGGGSGGLPVVSGTPISPYSTLTGTEFPTPPSHNTSNNNTNRGGGSGGGTYIPMIPPPAPTNNRNIGGPTVSGTIVHPKGTDFEEPEIYIPPGADDNNNELRPSAPTSQSVASQPTVQAQVQPSADSKSSYADLAARFDQLKK